MAPAEAAHCPSCSRFIGPAQTCPYCDAEARGGAPLGWLRLAAWLIACLGLALLYVFARTTPVPALRARDISPLMDRARVRVAGVVDGEPRAGRTRSGSEYYSFRLRDESGPIRVVSYGQTARELAAAGRLRAGDRVEAEGALSVSADEPPEVRLRSSSHVRPAGAP